jgi:hypothetical protein
MMAIAQEQENRQDVKWWKCGEFRVRDDRAPPAVGEDFRARRARMRGALRKNRGARGGCVRTRQCGRFTR